MSISLSVQQLNNISILPGANILDSSGMALDMSLAASTCDTVSGISYTNPANEIAVSDIDIGWKLRETKGTGAAAADVANLTGLIVGCQVGVQQAIRKIQQDAAYMQLQNPISPPTDAPTRVSTKYITDTNAIDHLVVIKSGGTVWDAYVTQKNSANGITNWNDFKVAVAVGNPHIADLNKVSAGTILYLPEKQANGSITNNYSSGASINIKAATDEYFMVVPDGYGGASIYSKTRNLDGSCAFSQTNTNQNREQTLNWSGKQNAVTGDIQTVSAVSRNDTNGDGKTDQVVSVNFDSTGRETIDTKNLNASGTLKDETTTTISANKKIKETKVDSNADGKWDQITLAADTNTDSVFDQTFSTGDTQNSLFNADKQLNTLRDKGLLSDDIWSDYMAWSTSRLVNTKIDSLNYNQPINTAPGLDPIGAFYGSKSAGTDAAASIANKTFRILGSAYQAVTAAQLVALDANKDGKLTGTELTGLNAWTDSNEDGIGQTPELTTLVMALANAGLSSVRFTDNSFYTAGNASFTTLAQISALAPASNYRTLRDTDNIYWINSSRSIRFGASQIKINNSKRTYLIGTDGNDTFDANYYVNYNENIFNTNLLESFLAGEGNDQMGGSARKDKLWGGTGNDTLDGYAGDDELYGEEGRDLLQGGNGNDTLSGGHGDDSMLGGLGSDQMWGGVGNDELQGGDDNDRLNGDEGNDHLYGGGGNDTIYGGTGNDLIEGGAADNKAAWAPDNNFLYGGAGNDTIIGGLNNDYIDGGSGADNMRGGKGDEIYSVNSVNDVILEEKDEGNDTAVSSLDYILNANVENLRLAEGFNINGTGNSLNNSIIGNSQDNILDGGTGNDTMIGGKGDDSYYVDNVDDHAVELASEGRDTVNSRISYTLGANVENLTLLDFSKAQKGIADGANSRVYGYPKACELDYMQGNAVVGYKGTCGMVSIANLATQANKALSEAQVVQTAINNNWCVTSSTATDYQRGASNYVQQQSLLNAYGFKNDVIKGYNEQAIANLIKGGRGVIISLNAGKLWGDNNYLDNGGVNHVVTLSGVACDATTGAIKGFYIADSGRGLVSDMTRYVSIADFRNAANVVNAYSIYTIDPVKLWEENINATGNELANVITGNRGNNVLKGGLGNDTLIGQAGDDTYEFTMGDGSDTLIDNDPTPGNTDVLQLTNINQTKLWFEQIGNNLQIYVMGTTDKITLKGWYVRGTSGTDNHIERIKTADGLTMYDTDVEQFVQAMSAFAKPAATTTSWMNGQTSNGKVLMTVTH